MKVLMIGMDGAHREAFRRGWTPFIEELLNTQTAYSAQNNLLSRGWLEIATGKNAASSSAMYDKPMVDGSLDWSLDFSVGDIVRPGDDHKEIWHELNKRGYKVGVMNLPTTFPAPKVNGFFVSGGGGGAPVTERATGALCYPSYLSDTLNNLGYIVDKRLYQLVAEKGLSTAKQIFKELALKNEKRTDGFLALDKKFNVDFGFIVYKTSSVFAETFYTTEMKRRQTNKADNDTIQALERYYQSFDREVKKLRTAYPDADLVFVSDHGTEPRRFTVNPNVFLKSHGMYEPIRSQSKKKFLVEYFKRIVPFKLKYFLKRKISKNAQAFGSIEFDPATTIAFCKTFGDWRHGIYVNDNKRFSGPVPSTERKDYAKKICDLVNGSSLAASHGIVAMATQSANKSTGDWYPDVEFCLPDGYLTSDKSKNFIEEFSPSGSTSALSSIMRGDILSVKSQAPLFYSSINNEMILSKENIQLTDVYKLILDRFSE